MSIPGLAASVVNGGVGPTGQGSGITSRGLAADNRSSEAAPLGAVRLPPLMKMTAGAADVVIGLIDGPVAVEHPDLVRGNMRIIPGRSSTCLDTRSTACRHGTFVAGVLTARRGAQAPAIAPGCTILIRPVFSDAELLGPWPATTVQELAAAIVDCVDAGAQILNLSATLDGSHIRPERDVEQALDYAAQRAVIVAAAAGNEGALASSPIIRHSWVIPVVAYSRDGLPWRLSNMGGSIGRVGAPGDGVASLAPDEGAAVLTGTSIATPFVAGAAALLRSSFPHIAAAEVRYALLSSAGRRRGVVPPLMDAWAAYEMLSNDRGRRAR